MPPVRRYKVDPRRVVHETIDGETILIDLETGSYYSLTGTGADIWALLSGGWTLEEAVAELQRRYEERPDVIEHAMRRLARELVREGLLESAETDPADGRNSNRAQSVGNGSRRAFAEPELQKYSDMQYFLLLDPIHEADAWPHEDAGISSGSRRAD